VGRVFIATAFAQVDAETARTQWASSGRSAQTQGGKARHADGSGRNRCSRLHELSQSFAGTIFRKVRSNASGLSYASTSRAVRQVQTGVQMTDPEDRRGWAAMIYPTGVSDVFGAVRGSLRLHWTQRAAREEAEHWVGEMDPPRTIRWETLRRPDGDRPDRRARGRYTQHPFAARRSTWVGSIDKTAPDARWARKRPRQFLGHEVRTGPSAGGKQVRSRTPAEQEDSNPRSPSINGCKGTTKPSRYE
jgi:hypothetical protein